MNDSPFYCFFSPNMQKLPLLFVHDTDHKTQTTLSKQTSSPPLLHIHARESPYGCSQHFLDEDARPPEPHRKLSCYQRGREGLCLQLQYHSPAEDKRPN